MRYKLFLFAAILLAGMQLQAQTVYMQMTSAEIQEFPSATVDNMNFQNNHLQFQLNDGTTQTINFSMVRRLFFDVSFGIEQANPVQAELLVFPNPASDQISLKQSGMYGQTAYIYSISGVLVKSFVFESEETHLSIEDLESGIYFVRCQLFNSKFIKL